MPPRQFQKVIGLEDHVVEFEEAQILLPFQPQFHRIETEHAVDREMTAEFAQKIDIVKAQQPIGIVHHNSVRGAVAESEEMFKDHAHAFHVACDLCVVQQLPRFLPARRVADPGRAAAHENDGLVAVALKKAQPHDRHQRPHVKAVGGTVEAAIGGDGVFAQGGVEARFVGALMQKPTLGNDTQEIRFGGGHGWAPFISMQLPYVAKAHNAGPLRRGLTSRPRPGLLPSWFSPTCSIKKATCWRSAS